MDCFPVTINGGAVVLTENTGASVTPNWVSFDNCVLNGPTSYVAVRTESGSAITNPTPVAFQIYADKQSIYRGTAGMNTTTYSFVESGLESNYSYETRRVFTDRQQTLTATGSITVDILEGRTVRFAQTGATTVTGVDNGATDDEIKFLFTGSGSNVTVQDRSVAGSLYLQGASNFSTTAQDTLVMAYDDVATNWYETSRSAN